MNHQQASDLALVAAGVLAMAAFGVLESVVKDWLQRRRDYRVATTGLRRRMR